jgi:hypothetical protein
VKNVRCGTEPRDGMRSDAARAPGWALSASTLCSTPASCMLLPLAYGVAVPGRKLQCRLYGNDVRALPLNATCCSVGLDERPAPMAVVEGRCHAAVVSPDWGAANPVMASIVRDPWWPRRKTASPKPATAQPHAAGPLGSRMHDAATSGKCVEHSAKLRGFRRSLASSASALC